MKYLSLTKGQIDKIIEIIENKKCYTFDNNIMDERDLFKFNPRYGYSFTEHDPCKFGIFKLAIKKVEIRIMAQPTHNNPRNTWIRVMMYWNFINGGANGCEIMEMLIDEKENIKY